MLRLILDDEKGPLVCADVATLFARTLHADRGGGAAVHPAA